MQNDIAERRITLSVILINLLQQQEERHLQLLETMKQIEYQRDLMVIKNKILFLHFMAEKFVYLYEFIL